MNSWKLGKSRNSMMWVGIGTAAAGVATSLYGANQQSKAINSANDTNKAIADEANRVNYQRWLESQGVGPNGEAVNTWLPRWATMNPNVGSSAQPRKFKYAGSAASATGSSGTTTPARIPTTFTMPSASISKFAGKPAQ